MHVAAMNQPQHQQQPLYQQHQHRQHHHPHQQPQYASSQQLQATAAPLHIQLPPPQAHLMGNNNHYVGHQKSSPQSQSQHSQSPPPPPTRHQSQQSQHLHLHPSHQITSDPTQLIEADFSDGAVKSASMVNALPVVVVAATADDVLEEKRYGCYRFGVLIAIIIILVLIGGTVPIAFVVTNRQIILLATCVTLLLVAILVFVSVGWQHRAARVQRQKFGRNWTDGGTIGGRTTMGRPRAAPGNSQHPAAGEPLYTSVPTLYRGQRPAVATPAQQPPPAREFYNSSNKSTRTSWAFMGHQYNTVAVRQQQQLLQHQLQLQLQQQQQQQQQQEQYKLRTNRKLFGPSAETTIADVEETRRLYDVVDTEAELAENAWTMSGSARKPTAPRRIITTQI